MEAMQLYATVRRTKQRNERETEGKKKKREIYDVKNNLIIIYAFIKLHSYDPRRLAGRYEHASAIYR